MDEHSLDQLVIYMALAHGKSTVKGPPRAMITSLHVETAVHMGAWPRCRTRLLFFARLSSHITQSNPFTPSTAEAITGVRFTQQEEGDGGALVLEVAEGGMGFTGRAT